MAYPFREVPFIRDPETPLLKLGPTSYFRLRQAFEGVHCFGMIGGGKSSGPGKTLAHAYLRAGMGGIVLVAKPEEVQTWVDYARETHRSHQLVIFDERRAFNFIAYELARQGFKGLGSVIECLMQVLAAADRVSPGAGAKDPEPFWEQAIRQVLNYSIPLLYSAWGTVTVASVIDFVTSAATDGKQYLDAKFVQWSFAARTIRQVIDAPKVPIADGYQQTLTDYWAEQFTAIPEKTRGNITISLSTRLDRFRHGRMRDCFCGRTDIVPEMTFAGAIIVMAMPTLTWNEDGAVGQVLFKYMWQRAVLARNELAPEQRERPVFLWADEAQYFVTESDHAFLSTCRASRAAVVYLTQTLPTYNAQLGAGKQDAAEALIGKFATQLFCANACAKTNKYASDLIGRSLQQRANSGRSTGWNTNRGMNSGANTGQGASSGGGGSYGESAQVSHNYGSSSNSGNSWGDSVGRGRSENWSSGTSEQMDAILEPRFFAEGLLTGGPRNRNLVSCVWFKAGTRFADAGGNNFLLARFRQ